MRLTNAQSVSLASCPPDFQPAGAGRLDGCHVASPGGRPGLESQVSPAARADRVHVFFAARVAMARRAVQVITKCLSQIKPNQNQTAVRVAMAMAMAGRAVN